MEYKLGFFILNAENEPVEVDMMTWAQDGHERRIVKQETLESNDKVFISTVFIGLGDMFTGRPFFETMIFGGPLDQYQARVPTWEQALEQHEEAKLQAVAGVSLMEYEDL
jgi:hypothetical protein